MTLLHFITFPWFLEKIVSPPFCRKKSKFASSGGSRAAAAAAEATEESVREADETGDDCLDDRDEEEDEDERLFLPKRVGDLPTGAAGAK